MTRRYNSDKYTADNQENEKKLKEKLVDCQNIEIRNECFTYACLLNDILPLDITETKQARSIVNNATVKEEKVCSSRGYQR